MTNETNVEYQQTSRQYLRVIVGLFFVVAMVIFGIWLVPKGLALYHQILGGQLLYQALELEKGGANLDNKLQKPIFWAEMVEPLIDSDAREIASEALSQMEKAIGYEPGLSHAYLLLGRIHLLLDEPHAAVESYRKLVQMRPDNPLGHWELALALEMACPFEELVSSVSDPLLVYTTFCKDDKALEAIQDEWKAIGVDGKDFMMSGVRAVELRQYDEALVWFNRAAIFQKEDPLTLYLALTNMLIGNQNRAYTISSIEGIEAVEMLTLGDVYRRKGLWEQARASYDLANRLYQLGSKGQGFEQKIISWTEVINRDFQIDSGFDFGVGDQYPNNGIPDGWTVYNYQGGHYSTWAEFDLLEVSDPEIEGMLQIKPKRSDLDIVVASNPIVVDAGNEFVAHCKALRLSNNLRIRLEAQFWDLAGHNLGFQVSEELLSVEEWEVMSISGITPKDAKWFVLRLRIFEVNDNSTVLQFRAIYLKFYINE